MKIRQVELLLILYEYNAFKTSWLSSRQIALDMGIEPSQVINLIHCLEKEGLIIYKPYHGARLTPLGFAQTHQFGYLEILWAVLLKQVLGLSWAEAFVEARRLCAATSQRLRPYLELWYQQFLQRH